MEVFIGIYQIATVFTYMHCFEKSDDIDINKQR